MRSSWTGPSDPFAEAKPKKQPQTPKQQRQTQRKNHSDEVYRALVVDSGPIIKHTGTNTLYGKAQSYYTVPAVIEEIRDAKARSHLEQWPMELLVKEPSPEAMARVAAFSKLTGDYASLSKVDLQVLALVVDLEKEGCRGSLDHLRTTPKRKIGLGIASDSQTTEKARAAAKAPQTTEAAAATTETPPPLQEEEKEEAAVVVAAGTHDIEAEIEFVYDSDEDSDDDDHDDNQDNPEETKQPERTPARAPAAPVSWAKMVDASKGSAAVEVPPAVPPATTNPPVDTTVDGSDQFDDAADDDDDEEETPATAADEEQALQKELESDFPSLSAAATVPYEGSDDEGDEEDHAKNDDAGEEAPGNDEAAAAKASSLAEEEEERRRRKEEALKPVSKSGKLYNSFRKYGKLMKPKPASSSSKNNTQPPKQPLGPLMNIVSDDAHDSDRPLHDPTRSRMLGSAAASGAEEMRAEDDDGEGWITSTKDIARLKTRGGKGSHGGLDPSQKPAAGPDDEPRAANAAAGPSVSQRTACTTTDFAMQNVLLQMGLLLLSVDGMRIRKMKSWVLRCGACFKIHTESVDPKTGMRRMFCSHCGSDMMDRVSASVDGKTGRLRLHLSKKHKHNLRGTKFSLPKAGNGNRFQGDLLLREDQLMMGAWNQKVKKNSGGKSRAHAQSIFGKDIATNVGCRASAALPSDIRVGFGRRNPNSAKGRERRGKKKKSSDRACGLRRY